ncbi:MAG: PqqD family protein [Merdibacter sp.]
MARQCSLPRLPAAESTQAKLWADHRGARTINGDRTLLCKEDGVYQACGWPICGSSQICYNEQYPLACIVVVVKGKENEVIELDYKQRVKRLISELTINYHYADFVNAAIDFIDDLAKTTKIYQLTCDISEDAVRCLEGRNETRPIDRKEGRSMKKMKEFILREVADEYILIPTGKTTEEFNGIISLTETAAFIYNHIEEADSFEALINMITSEYNVDKETAAKDAYVFINHMISTGLVDLTDREKNW